jgi:hypothetical protein
VIPIGISRFDAVAEEFEDIIDSKSGCPKTTLAFSPLENGDVKPSTRLLKPLSVTQIFPERSMARASGAKKPDGVVWKNGVEVKSVEPRTRLALSPVEKGGLNSKTLLSELSATQRLPDESNSIPPGWSREA